MKYRLGSSAYCGENTSQVFFLDESISHVFFKKLATFPRPQNGIGFAASTRLQYQRSSFSFL
jgi:hypothetical protein